MSPIFQMKRYLLQIADSDWRDLTTLANELNHSRRKHKLPRIHRAQLIRLAVSHLCSLPAEQFNSIFAASQLSNDQETN